ncbi:MAG: hypothetical protein KA748_00620 [Halomonas sp.]|nr:hypothetical protein [Halomonas sp.]MBP5978696.1 hypothetical protein [Halomonas sp.]
MKYAGYIVTFSIAVVVAVGLSVFSIGVLAEQPGRDAVKQIDQSSICIASTDRQALECPEGGLFLARLAINDADVQAPMVIENRVLNTMALYCDTNFAIQHTQTGVLCVLTHKRMSTQPQNGMTQEAESASQTPD